MCWLLNVTEAMLHWWHFIIVDCMHRPGFRLLDILTLENWNSSPLASPFHTQECLLLCSEAKLNYWHVLAENFLYSRKLDDQTICQMDRPNEPEKVFGGLLTNGHLLWPYEGWSWIYGFNSSRLSNLWTVFLATLSKH